MTYKTEVLYSIEIMRQCYPIALRAERLQGAKSQKSQRLKIGKSCYFTTVYCAIAKNLSSSKCEKPLDC